MADRKGWIRLGVSLLVLAAAGVARHLIWPDLGPDDARQWIHSAGPWAPAAYLAAFVLASALFVPSTLFLVAAGAAFGVPWGLAWAYGGTVAGALAAFTLARHTKGRLRNWIEGRIPDDLHDLEREPAALTALRAVPLTPDGLFNAAAGAGSTRWKGFLAATAIGAIPGVLAYTMLGTVIGGLRLDDPSTWPWTLGATVAAITLFVSLGAWLVHRQQKAAGRG